MNEKVYNETISLAITLALLAIERYSSLEVFAWIIGPLTYIYMYVFRV